MGMQDIMFGYIEEAHPGHAGGPEENQLKFLLAKEIREHNRTIINQLPLNDSWPPLSRKMFNFIPNHHFLTYKNTVIVFGGSFKSICNEWPEWLAKFEAFLKNLYWESVSVRLESELVGTQEFKWKPKMEWIEKLCNRDLQKIQDWDFSGERKF